MYQTKHPLPVHRTDNGPGIAEDSAERVFGLFEKAHSGTAESTGIGLSIVKRIVEENNGRVWVESEVGVGSTFVLPSL
jgi:signal transduction histidine kinase